MSYTFYGLVFRDGQTLSYASDTTQLVNAHLDKTVYVTLGVSTGVLQIDINKFLTRVPNVNTDQSYEALLNGVDELMLTNYNEPLIPIRDTVTNMYTKRISQIDPYMDSTYDVSYTSIYYPSIKNDIYRRGMCDDLCISVPTGTDPSTLLPFVNGVFHQYAILDQDLYVLDGFANMRMTKKKNLVLLDTSSVGGHEFIPFTNDMIASDLTALQNGVLIKSPSPLDDVTVFVVIDGYLFFESDYVKKLSSSTVRINTCLMEFPYMFAQHPLTKGQADTFGDKTLWTNPYYADVDPLPPVVNPQPDYPSKANDPYLDTFVTTPVQPISNFTSSDFVLSRLEQPNSGLILIKSKDLFKLEFALSPDDSEREYITFNPTESARGILKYDTGFVLPYNVLYAMDGLHRVFIQDPMEYENLEHYSNAGYISKLALHPTTNSRPRFAKLTDFYSA